MCDGPRAIARSSDQMHRRRTSSEDRVFVLQRVQPALLGLMDGSVSTLAPLFAAAGLSKNASETFFVGLAASLGAGISMGLAEALSDDGSLTGRGRPWLRGLICGMMTALGGVGHTLPFLIPDFRVAMTAAFVARWTSDRIARTCAVAALDCSASARISCATTAKPRPCSPARVASMAAFSASMFD